MSVSAWLFAAALVIAGLLWVSPWLVGLYIRAVEKWDASRGGSTVKLVTSWTCPACGTAVPIELAASTTVDIEAGLRNARMTVTMPDAALADVFAHAWPHRGGQP